MAERTAEQRIKAAIKYLETEGWCKGAYRKDAKKNSGPACLVGALATKKELGPDSWGFPDTVSQAVQAMGFSDRWQAVTWNDDTKRRKAQVLQRLRECLEALTKEKRDAE